MLQHTRHVRWPVAIAMASLVVACSGTKDDKAALAADSTLARDLARVGGDTAVTPALKDVPTTPAEKTEPAAPSSAVSKPRPSAPKPRPTKPAPTPTPTTPPPATNTTATGNTVEKGPGTAERPMGTIASGSTLRLGAADKVCTNTNHVGDRFIATLTEPVTGSNGATIPSGASVTLEVTQLKRSENSNDQIVMGFRVVSVAFDGRTYPVDADVQTAEISRVRASSTSNDAKKVAGGAVAGAILGQVLGKNRKGTLIGAAVGAAAGGAAAVATANYEGCVNSGATIVVKLNAPLTVAVKA